MTTTRRLFYAGGALLFATMFGRCDTPANNTLDGGADLRPPDTISPTLSLIAPSAASNAGGTMVTLTGTNFKSGATVTFGGVSATQVMVVSATQITCVVPAKAATCGQSAVVVQNPDSGMVSTQALFQYRPSTLAFAAPQTLSMAQTPRQVIAVDIDGDGNIDLLSANSGSGSVSLRTGMGNGMFADVKNIDVAGGSPFALAAVDLNNDSKLDIVTVHRQSNMLKVRLGTGGGQFMVPSTDSFSVGAAPYDLAVGKLNADNNLDVVVANSGSNNVSILTGKGDGTFNAAATSTSTGTGPQAIILAQLNSDQNLDYVVANNGGTNNFITARLGDGMGNFSTTSATLTTLNASIDLVAGDFNSDGTPDVAVASSATGAVHLGLGRGDGTFLPGSALSVGTTALSDRSIAVGDFNLDGNLDLAVSNVVDGTVSVLLGGGDSSFAGKADFQVGAMPTHISVADLNKDGLPDLITTDQNANNVVIRLNMCQ